MKRMWIEDDKVEVGLDEAGRGSLWGRLYVGAVILSPDDEAYSDHGVVLLHKIRDSKTLSRRKRAILADFIKENAIGATVAFSEPAEIDNLNVLHADMAAMHRALDAMPIPFERILIDGDYWTPWTPSEEGATAVDEQITIVDGDAKSLTIAAASILAKESHDSWVKEQIEADPTLHERYGFGTNMGYGTASHLAGLKKWGPHSLHRQSFRPVSQGPQFRK